MERLPLCGVMLARWELKTIISEMEGQQQRSSEDPPRYLRLLRRYPKLAKERFLRDKGWSRYSYQKRYIYPLTFLLEIGADLPVVQEVLHMYPRALVKSVNKAPAGLVQMPGKSPMDFPLHFACQLGRVSDEVIVLLAQASPRTVAALPDSTGSLPLHSLLRNPNRSATVTEVQALLNIHEDAINKNCYFGTPILLACKSNSSTEVLEFLAHRYLESIATNTDGTQMVVRMDQRFTFNLTHAQTFSLVLPKLKIFRCLPRYWRFPAFQHLMRELQHQQRLLDLRLHLPYSLLSNNEEEVSDSIEQLLVSNSVLESLHIDFGKDNGLDCGCLRVCLRKLVGGLCQNRTLRECHLSGEIMTRLGVEFYQKRFFRPLAKLQGDNVTLEWISIPQLLGTSTCAPARMSEEEEKVHFWTRLNRFGRAQARDPGLTNTDLVGLLVKANQLSADDNPPEIDRLNILFTLLLECPSVWSSEYGLVIF